MSYNCGCNNHSGTELPVGPPGNTGATGPQGPRGYRGFQGNTGLPGNDGIDGIDGIGTDAGIAGLITTPGTSTETALGVAILDGIDTVKGVANGIPNLGVDSKIPAAFIPHLWQFTGAVNLLNYASLKTPVAGGYDWSASMAAALSAAAAFGVRRVLIPSQASTIGVMSAGASGQSLTLADVTNVVIGATYDVVIGNTPTTIRRAGLTVTAVNTDTKVVTVTGTTTGVTTGDILMIEGSYKYFFTAGFEIPTETDVIGFGKPALDFSLAGNVVAVTLRTRARMENFYLIGNSKLATATGIKFNGDHIVVKDLRIRFFGTGYNGVSENSYINSVKHSVISDCGIAIDQRLAGVTTNSGEKIIFHDVTLANSDHLVYASGSTLDMFFTECSFDYFTDMGDFDNGQYYFTNCHVETGIALTPQGFLFKKRNGANMSFTNVRFGMVGISFIIDPATEGTSGSVLYKSCRCHFTPTAGGASINVGSDYSVFMAGGSTTATFDSPFISRTVIASVSIGLHSGNPGRAVTVPAVSFAASSTLATVTYASAPPSNTVAIVRFG